MGRPWAGVVRHGVLAGLALGPAGAYDPAS